MMPANSNNEGLLSSWKEIASYLSCDERTCRRWELNLGLPIHRMEDSPKSRVHAYRHELEVWRKERLSSVLSQKGKDLAARNQHGLNAVRALPWLLPLMAVVIIGAVFLLRPEPGPPADFKIEGPKLTVLDNKGKVLWVFDTGLPNLENEKVYRERFQAISENAIGMKPLFPYLIMKDINSDEKTEVIFGTKTKFEQGEGELFCFNDKGRKIWAHTLGREVEFGGRTYSADFRIQGFMTFDIDHDKKLEILVFAPHQPHSPTQLLILSTDGQVKGEYFNFGQMHDFLCCDLDGDEKEELLIAGQNDEYGKGCLIVFDPLRVGGCSPQITEYAGEGLTPGTEKCYILFPRTDVDQILNPLKEALIRIDLLHNDRIQLNTVISHIFFELDPKLRLQDVKGSDYFRIRHHEFKAAGRITSVLNDAYYEALKKGVLYWDGAEWTSTPTMIRSLPAQGP